MKLLFLVLLIALLNCQIDCRSDFSAADLLPFLYENKAYFGNNRQEYNPNGDYQNGGIDFSEQQQDDEIDEGYGDDDLRLSIRNNDFHNFLNNIYNPYAAVDNSDDGDDGLFVNDPQESESHSSLPLHGYQYVSGGAGEGKQHLQPNGQVPNKEEVKSDIDLPAYCEPPNPCPVGYKGEDCDPSPYSQFTAEYSKQYQSLQNCMCDTDHNECKKGIDTQKLSNIMGNMDNFLPVVAKKSPRNRRDVSDKEEEIVADNQSSNSVHAALPHHIAKKG